MRYLSDVLQIFRRQSLAWMRVDWVTIRRARKRRRREAMQSKWICTPTRWHSIESTSRTGNSCTYTEHRSCHKGFVWVCVCLCMYLLPSPCNWMPNVILFSIALYGLYLMLWKLLVKTLRLFGNVIFLLCTPQVEYTLNLSYRLVFFSVILFATFFSLTQWTFSFHFKPIFIFSNA